MKLILLITAFSCSFYTMAQVRQQVRTTPVTTKSKILIVPSVEDSIRTAIESIKQISQSIEALDLQAEALQMQIAQLKDQHNLILQEIDQLEKTGPATTAADKTHREELKQNGLKLDKSISTTQAQLTANKTKRKILVTQADKLGQQLAGMQKRKDQKDQKKSQ